MSTPGKKDRYLPKPTTPKDRIVCEVYQCQRLTPYWRFSCKQQIHAPEGSRKTFSIDAVVLGSQLLLVLVTGAVYVLQFCTNTKTNTFLFIKIDCIIVTQVGFCHIYMVFISIPFKPPKGTPTMVTPST